jgi:hypothetical protein
MGRDPTILVWISEKQDKAMRCFCDLFGLVNSKTKNRYNKSECYRMIMVYLFIKKDISRKYKLTIPNQAAKMLQKAYENTIFQDTKTNQDVSVYVRSDEEFKKYRDELKISLHLNDHVSIIRSFLDGLYEVLNKGGKLDNY